MVIHCSNPSCGRLRLAVHFDDAAEVITIEGIRYSYDLFRAWGTKGMKTGQLFKVYSREDETITIEIIHGV